MIDVNSFIDEEKVWQTIDPNLMWIMDKLILSSKLEYTCGPVGTAVPKPDWYMVRPCVNALGLGLGAQKVWIKESTDHLTPGHFWCEWFEGRHFSVDYHYGLPNLIIEGFKDSSTFTNWIKWQKADDWDAVERVFDFPKILDPIIDQPWVNCEFIGNKLIEVHLRRNPDFQWDNVEFIPHFFEPGLAEMLDMQEEGYKWVDYPDIHGRIGAFVK